jgi:hypothetical protein
MSTRAIIGKQIDNDSYFSVYLHREGYVEYSGLLLQKNYATPERVDQLLALGDMSSLGISIDSCLFYNRDSKESWEQVKPKIRNLQEICSEEWVYIWDDTQWLGSESKSFNLIPIQNLLAV